MAKYLIFESEDLSLIPRIHMIRMDMVRVYTESQFWIEAKRIPRVPKPASLA